MKNLGDELINGMEKAVAYMRHKKSRAIIHNIAVPKKVLREKHIRHLKQRCNG